MGLFDGFLGDMFESALSNLENKQRQINHQASQYSGYTKKDLAKVVEDKSSSSIQRVAAAQQLRRRKEEARRNAQVGLSKKQLQENKEIIEMMDEMDDYVLDSDYRNVAFRNSESNHGWYVCAKCGRKFRRADMDVDHIQPRSKGGDNSRYNLQLLCKHCNRSKQADTADTKADLARRRKEIQEQREDDFAFLNTLTQQENEKKATDRKKNEDALKKTK